MLNYEFHYPLTDFPVAFLLAAAGFEMGAYLLKRPEWFRFARSLLWLGSAGAVLAIVSGLWLVHDHPDLESKALDRHHLFAYLSMAASTVAVILDQVAERYPKYRLFKSFFVITAAIMVSLAGFFGGKMAH